MDRHRRFIFDQMANILRLLRFPKIFKKKNYSYGSFGSFFDFFYLSSLDILLNTGIKELESNTQNCVFSTAGIDML